MKKLHILILGLFCMLSYSCIKEGGNQFKPELPAAAVDGYQKTYTVFTHRDTLKINPAVADEAQYDFLWTVYSTNFNVNAGVVPKPDTLATTKNLQYEVLLNPGQYILILNVKNKKTAVTQMITSTLSVSTLTMSGWYMLKDNGTKTDFDFVYNGGRIDNWMANFNEGKSLKGKAIKSIYAGSFKASLTSTDQFGVLVAITDEDAAIYRLDNGKMVMNFDQMFFTKPEVRKPQNILQPQADNTLNLINDGKVYNMTKGALFADSPPSTYKISPVSALAALVVVFDQNSRSLLCLNSGVFSPFGTAGASLKNMTADLVWIGGYAGMRGVVMTLFRQDSGDGLLVKLDGTYGPLAGLTSTLIQGTRTVPKAHGLMSADVIGGNYDSDYIYYAKGNKIYMTDFASTPENLQITLSEGEVVTSIQHIKYPVPSAATVVSTTDYLAIASYLNGRYKVWLHKISSTGTIQALPKPNFEGEGRVSSVNYLEQGIGNKTY
ncbi:MAG: PKD-like family lipoprotein [Bacteroidota bacterium]